MNFFNLAMVYEHNLWRTGRTPLSEEEHGNGEIWMLNDSKKVHMVMLVHCLPIACWIVETIIMVHIRHQYLLSISVTLQNGSRKLAQDFAPKRFQKLMRFCSRWCFCLHRKS
jgi:hypothetical protein